MNRDALLDLLAQVERGELSPASAAGRLTSPRCPLKISATPASTTIAACAAVCLR